MYKSAKKEKKKRKENALVTPHYLKLDTHIPNSLAKSSSYPGRPDWKGAYSMYSAAETDTLIYKR
jgi:hypothetical protein